MCFFLFPRAPKKRRYHPSAESSEEELIPKRRRATHYSARPVKYEPLRGPGIKRTPVELPAGVLRGNGAKREMREAPRRQKTGETISTMKESRLQSSKSHSSHVNAAPSKRRSAVVAAVSAAAALETSRSKRPSANNPQKRRPDSYHERSPRTQYNYGQQQQQYYAPQMAQVTQRRPQMVATNNAYSRYSYPSAASSSPPAALSPGSSYVSRNYSKQAPSSASSRDHPLYTNQTPRYVYSMPQAYYHDISALRTATSNALRESVIDPAKFEAHRANYSKSLRRQPAYNHLR